MTSSLNKVVLKQFCEGALHSTENFQSRSVLIACLRSNRSRTSRTNCRSSRNFLIQNARKMGREQNGRARGVGEGKEFRPPCPSLVLLALAPFSARFE